MHSRDDPVHAEAARLKAKLRIGRMRRWNWRPSRHPLGRMDAEQRSVRRWWQMPGRHGPSGRFHGRRGNDRLYLRRELDRAIARKGVLEHQLDLDRELHGDHQPFRRVLLPGDVQPRGGGDERELAVDLGQDLGCSLVTNSAASEKPSCFSKNSLDGRVSSTRAVGGAMIRSRTPP